MYRLNEERILVVDDEESICGLIRKILESHGYTVSTVNSAREAKTLIEKQQFSLILTDLQMPGESGLELAGYLRNSFPEIPVIIVTIIDDLQTAKEALALDIYGYIVKPVDRNQLLISIDNALRRRNLEREASKCRENLEKAVESKTRQLAAAKRNLRSREKELENRARELEDLNSALRVLLKKREEDRTEIEERIVATIKKNVLPRIDRMSSRNLSEEQRLDLEILRSSLEDIVSPFIKNLSSSFLDLTPTEIEVAQLIRQGFTTKEIASAMRLSLNTIMTHRYKIRTKLGLKKQKKNLRTFLRSLNEQ